MTITRDGLRAPPLAVWILTAAAWVAGGWGSPVPPWRAADVLSREQLAAHAVAASAFPVEAWSMDVGSGRQRAALGEGWSEDEAFQEAGARRSFAWIDGAVAELSFASDERPRSELAVRGFPLDSLAPLDVDVELDGRPAGSLRFPRGWADATLDLGPLTGRRHVLRLRPRARERPAGEARTLSLAVDAVSVGPQPVLDPPADRGVFQGFVRAGLQERPAVFASSQVLRRAPAGLVPPGTSRVAAGPGLEALYGFGVGRAATSLGAVAEAANGLAAAAFVVFVPGLCWTALLPTRGASRLALSVGISALVLLLAFLGLRLLGRAPGPLSLAVTLTALSALPLPWLRGRGGMALAWLPLLSASAAALVLVACATVVVPPLEDQDMETQGTAHGLAFRQVPRTVTNRGTTSFFAHPPLVHLWQAGTFALGGRLARVAYYDEAAERARLLPFREPAAGAPLEERPHYAEWKRLLARFLAEPVLWTTRQANVLAASVAVGLVALLVRALTGSTAAALALAALTATLPDFLVRASYGGYFSAATLLSLLALAVIQEGASGTAAGTAGALAFLADQKGALVPLASVVPPPFGKGRGRLALLGGVVAAAAAFALYGASVDPGAFAYEFVREHVVRRLDPRHWAEGSAAYPSVRELWTEYAGRYGLVFVGWIAAAAAWGARDRRPEVRTAAVAVLLGAAVFSVTDWRQTKHLAQLTGPAVIALAGTWPASPPWQRGFLGLAAAVVLRNLWAAAALLADLELHRPRAGW